MLRTLSSKLLPLKHVASRAVVARTLPALTTATPYLQNLCEFSTKVHRRKNTTVDTTHEKEYDPVQQQESTWSPWYDDFFRARGGFDDVFARDPFFAPFFQRRGGDDPFERMRKEIMSEVMPVLRSPLAKTPFPSRLVRASPGYEIKESKGVYEIALDIPHGLETKDLKVELGQDGTIVHVSGERKHTSDDAESFTRFSKRFSIGDGVDAERLQANFSEGCLVIRVPKLEAADQPKRQIPITNRPHEELTEDEMRYKSYNDAFDESDWVETGKKAA